MLFLSQTYDMNGHVPMSKINLRNELLEIKQEDVDEGTSGQIVATENVVMVIKQKLPVDVCTDQTADYALLPESHSKIEQLQKKLSGLVEEKEKLLGELVQSKAEHQRIYFDLQKQMETIAQHDQKEKALTARVLVLEQEKLSFDTLLSDKNATINRLQTELHKMKEDFEFKVSKYEKDLKECNVKISQKLKEKNTRLKDSRSHSELYDVEDIMDHRIVNGKEFFLVRWEGYSADEDTWEPENIVNKLSVFKKYVKANPL